MNSLDDCLGYIRSDRYAGMMLVWRSYVNLSLDYTKYYQRLVTIEQDGVCCGFGPPTRCTVRWCLMKRGLFLFVCPQRGGLWSLLRLFVVRRGSCFILVYQYAMFRSTNRLTSSNSARSNVGFIADEASVMPNANQTIWLGEARAGGGLGGAPAVPLGLGFRWQRRFPLELSNHNTDYLNVRVRNGCRVTCKPYVQDGGIHR